MALFLCSNFLKSGKLIKKKVEGKNILFIPAASIDEEYKGYVDSACQLWQEMNANVIDLELSAASSDQTKRKPPRRWFLFYQSSITPPVSWYMR
ncbi:Type 1 glutamine amidotransferase-like domain-containing protein [Streptococcus parasanguinis]|uniref:Type 1 glutamine amidotransferase-like domain-containing protein n=1 Tax=Streptococcus parasanguinis TaxID=1318 RepID=UPI0034A1215A